MNHTNGYKGLVGISIRELTDNEYSKYCFNNENSYNLTYPPILEEETFSNNNSFRYDFDFKIVTSGCYFLDENTKLWSSEGVEILEKSNSTHTYCQSSHLTKFAGGWVVLPAKIDFSYAFANASFLKNPTIYATVIAITSLYLILAIWSIYMDKEDDKKIGFTILDDANVSEFDSLNENKYYYEIILFTGLTFISGSVSKVL